MRKKKNLTLPLKLTSLDDVAALYALKVLDPLQIHLLAHVLVLVWVEIRPGAGHGCIYYGVASPKVFETGPVREASDTPLVHVS